jgi:hypothetical protein
MAGAYDPAAPDTLHVLTTRHIDQLNALAGQQSRERKRQDPLTLDRLVPRQQVDATYRQDVDHAVSVECGYMHSSVLRLLEANAHRQLCVRRCDSQPFST